MVFEDAARTLAEWGVLDVILPFLFIFTILYALFLKTGLLGADENKKYAVVLSIAIAATVIIPHAVPALRGGPGELRIGGTVFPDLVFIINNSIPSIAIWIVGILMVMMITGVFTEKSWSPLGFTGSGFVAILAIALVVYLFGSAAGYFRQPPHWLQPMLTGQNAAALIVLLVFALIVKYVITDKKTTGIDDEYKDLPASERLGIDFMRAVKGDEPAKWKGKRSSDWQ